MTSYNLGFLALVNVLVLTLPLAGEAHAQATFCDPAKQDCIGQLCNNAKGTTRLDASRQNIIACLESATSIGNWYWKLGSVTQRTCPTGQTMQGIKNGEPVCVQTDMTCPAGQVMQSIANGMPVCVAAAVPAGVNCGAGQVLQGIVDGEPVCVTAAGGGGVGSMFVALFTGPVRGDTGCDPYDLRYPPYIPSFPPPTFSPSIPPRCHVPNYMTGACSCPSGTRAQGLSCVAGERSNQGYASNLHIFYLYYICVPS
ncbi:MAG: hypothetical protein FWF24_01270 [Alphaproteobacteria bacterium]|nr:hypothetical protein [Alphaproteobacteria bacterium]